ncbi:hypothetical protein FE840_019870 (plasmid) [Peteryoungia desertarenae]|uniref:Uncharacterized protein n=1 Tax=Peteryoungia desertarenae TaxID=1813451 RepID=A0ABX6QUF4_9HYPH|nr:hypothetical protein [Peteryoungia desertarenae]QLF71860.1 hypothetical protein FE840_019870 [Peteryoungia desertarenae]
MKNSLFLIAAAVGSTFGMSSAQAEQKVLVAECHGKGARFFLSEVTQQEANVLMGTDGPMPDNAIIVIAAGKEPFWSTRSRKQIDQDCGGEGQDEIELFAGTQPRDGVWRTDISTRAEDCPTAIRQGLAGNLPGPESDSRSMKWPRPFDPNNLPRDYNPGHTWKPAGENRWTTSLLDAAGLPSFEGRQFARSTMVMTLKSETEITMSHTMQINLPGIAQQALGGGGNCRIITDSVSVWQSD